ncbi:MAG: transglutaminase family protein [Alphaproteobacteria bacterium]
MRYDVSHVTEFDYSQPVSISHHLLHLTPRACTFQISHQSRLVIDPAPAVNQAGSDYFGNPTTFIVVQAPHEKLTIRARSLIDVAPVTPPEPAATMPWDQVAAAVRADSSKPMLDIAQFMFVSPFTKAGDEVEDYARESFAPGRPVLDAARDLTKRIFNDFTYDGSATDVSTPVDEAMRLKRGVCQDFAHLQIACLRKLGLPARYVSGYLLTHPPEGKEKLTGADASHAWLSVWCPGHGWVDLDPTNDLIPGDEHITLAWGRDYGDVSPVNGVMVGGGEHEVKVAVDVRPLQSSRQNGRG